MKQMKLVFIFPENIVEEPVTYNLISDYGVRVNILRASIDPGKQGRMVVELSGEEIQISARACAENGLVAKYASLGCADSSIG